ncbi:hypothetical protein BVE84_00960 [Streptococcus azizii]|uniref:DUF454 domain-containing protein n=1 Tax=Streptococcus azizii TaxID=1579424 RepID=A0AB36JTG2_9STRE|nr:MULTISPECIES: DUF454 family protein [Streptococcus]MBF0776075.1 YbaN family protein [Streptococcus sp. 19428wD3_AN2]ONK28899.1 hypothetical protein BVE86_02115 [Streptococcus azizii]ONK30410.1 hypothetical protein BVE85_00350 [Streptococcus azizii]ONK31110.1 hypothetical protein BVE84_00960 [Streptococcus azizii]TFU83639.1 DUF454 domain-containing protein [Streptococcus sp. AN2]
MKKCIFLLCGHISLIVGVIGIFLPLIPTTPLLLLAGFCFAKSSKQLEARVRKSNIYQFYVADYAETKAIDRRRKKTIILQIYLLMGISIYVAPLLPVKILLACLTVFITYYLFFVIPDKDD